MMAVPSSTATAVFHRPAAVIAAPFLVPLPAPCRLGAAAFATVAMLGVAAAARAQSDPASGWRPDRVFGQLGRGVDTTGVVAGATWDWAWQRPLGRGLLTGYHELALGHWRSDTGIADRGSFTQFGATPALRYWPAGEAVRWFAEAGIGLNVLDPVYRTRDKSFSTALNFGDHLGVGYRSPQAGWEASLRLQHFSNAGLRKPNPGEDFLQLRWSIRL